MLLKSEKHTVSFIDKGGTEDEFRRRDHSPPGGNITEPPQLRQPEDAAEIG